MVNMKTILLTNDDGVNSSGILALKQSLSDLGDIEICAPLVQQSGIGHAISLFEPIRLTKTTLNDGTKAYAVMGTPTDAVLMGIYNLCEQKPDLVISGINMGENLGKSELTTSGTLGAAMEAAAQNIPALAVSIQVDCSIKFQNSFLDIDYTYITNLTHKIVEKILKYGLPEGADLLNLNIPASITTGDLEVSRLGERMYSMDVSERIDPRGSSYYWFEGEEVIKDEPGTDVDMIRNRKVPTITPIKLDCTGNIEELKNWLK